MGSFTCVEIFYEEQTPGTAYASLGNDICVNKNEKKNQTRNSEFPTQKTKYFNPKTRSSCFQTNSWIYPVGVDFPYEYPTRYAPTQHNLSLFFSITPVIS